MIEFMKLLIWYSHTESISANFCMINRVLGLFLILDLELQNTLSSLVRAGLYYSHTFKKISSLTEAAFESLICRQHSTGQSPPGTSDDDDKEKEEDEYNDVGHRPIFFQA